MHERRGAVPAAAVAAGLWLAAAGPAAAQVTAPEAPGEAAALVEAGDAAMRALDPKRAAEEYERAVALAPDAYEVRAKATLALRDAGEQLKVERARDAERALERAYESAQELLRRHPDRAEAHYYVASTSGQLALFRGGREKVRLSRDVERHAKRAIALDPSDARPHAVLGVYYREVANASAFLKMIARTLLGGLPNGTNEDAERELRSAVGLDPADVWATYELARTYEVMKRRDAEVDALRKVLALPARAQRDARLRAEAERRLAALGAR
jgi:tetratricopeptide (TPR) repeat protein